MSSLSVILVRLQRLLPFSASTTPLQAATYLLGISLFSISFLVYLNSAVSFVITDLIGVKHGVGDIVGTLGFVDEIVALIACPLWGLLSDRLGVRWVAVLGYTVIGISLFTFVQAQNVYPSLVIARILFAVGATAAATMVTASLPVLTDDGEGDKKDDEDSYVEEHNGNGGVRKTPRTARGSITLSVESELTITPERFNQTSAGRAGPSNGSSSSTSNGGAHLGAQNPVAAVEDHRGRKPAALAGLVGLFTGCGALVALTLFLPLPSQFSKKPGVTLAQAVTWGFYVVGTVAFIVALCVYFGFAGLKGEEGKGWRMLLGLKNTKASQNHAPTDYHDDPSDSAVTDGPHENGVAGPATPEKKPLPFARLLLLSLRLGVTDRHIALGYLGGFVARASTVAISLFIPLYVNTFFMSRGFCQGSPHDPTPELKEECRAAYVLTSILTGVAQLVALICAPLFGYLSHRQWRGINAPVMVATSLGVVGYLVFPRLASPEFKNVDDRGGSPWVFLVAALLGISQIGAIVCSLGSLGRGVLSAADGIPADAHQPPILRITREDGETDRLLADDDAEAHEPKAIDRVQLKGSIAGVYSWCGGAAILLLTKLGGYLFDSASTGAPFYMMAAFNAMLLVATLAIDLGAFVKKSVRT